MPKQKLPESEPGHKERFDGLFRTMAKPKKASGFVTFGDIGTGSPTIALGEVTVSNTTNREQVDAFIAAAARGEICGL